MAQMDAVDRADGWEQRCSLQSSGWVDGVVNKKGWIHDLHMMYWPRVTAVCPEVAGGLSEPPIGRYWQWSVSISGRERWLHGLPGALVNQDQNIHDHDRCCLWCIKQRRCRCFFFLFLRFVVSYFFFVCCSCSSRSYYYRLPCPRVGGNKAKDGHDSHPCPSLVLLQLLPTP